MLQSNFFGLLRADVGRGGAGGGRDAVALDVGVVGEDGAVGSKDFIVVLLVAGIKLYFIQQPSVVAVALHLDKFGGGGGDARMVQSDTLSLFRADVAAGGREGADGVLSGEADAVVVGGGVVADRAGQLLCWQIGVAVIGQRVEGIAVVVLHGEGGAVHLDGHGGVLAGGDIFINGGSSDRGGGDDHQAGEGESGEVEFREFFHRVHPFCVGRD